MIDVHDDVPTSLYTESEFRIFTDKAGTPLFGFEDISSQETHRTIHDNSIGRIADDHTLLIKKIQFVGHDFLKIGGAIDIICLRTLDGGNFFVCEESESHAEPVRFDTIVCIDQSYDFCTGVGEFKCFIESTRFIPLQSIKMIEAYIIFSEIFHKGLHRFPNGFIGCIIFYDDEFIMCIVELEHMFDCADEHIGFFIITGDMDGDKWFWSCEGTEICVGDVMADFSATNNLQIVSELVEYSSNREEHQGDIDPKLVEIDVVTNPGLVSYHDADIDEDEEGKSSREKSRDSESSTEPAIEDTYKEKNNTRAETDIGIKSYFFEEYTDGSE
jgi:hypothetical protein